MSVVPVTKPQNLLSDGQLGTKYPETICNELYDDGTPCSFVPELNSSDGSVSATAPTRRMKTVSLPSSSNSTTTKGGVVTVGDPQAVEDDDLIFGFSSTTVLIVGAVAAGLFFMSQGSK